MFKNLKELFEKQLRKGTDTHSNANILSLELAAAVLMLEISLADSTVQDIELNVIKNAMQNIFHLSREEAQSIVTLAEKELDHATSLYDFTRLINKSLSRNDKVKIIELLWKVAFADAVLDKYEEYCVRKISGLLHVSHIDYIKAKHNAAKNNS